jgi:RNA polymerase sigma-70 factor (ECF subfamily)
MPRAPEIHNADDAALLTALRAGDDVAFETLVRRFSGRMLTVARRLVTNEADAQECLQEAFLSAFKALPGFDGRSQLGTWLHRIVVNAALMKLRTRRRHPECSIDNLLPAFLDDGHQRNPGRPWKAEPAVLEREETRDTVRRKIHELPENYRTVLLLRDIEEYDTETVAQLLDLTTTAVKVRLHRARQALRSLLEPVFGGATS